jgi:hypothetical protein
MDNDQIFDPYLVGRLLGLVAGKPIEKIIATLDSGLPDVLFSTDPGQINELAFKRICKASVVPKSNELFSLVVENRIKHFVLVPVGSMCQLEFKEIQTVLTSDGCTVPQPECMDRFQEEFPKADGHGSICLARLSDGGEFHCLQGVQGELWISGKLDTRHKISNYRWLMEREI